MKANEFIKKHDLQYTKSIIEQFPKHTHVTNDGRMFINEDTCCNHIKNQLGELVKMSELKRLIESHELVEKRGGLSEAKAVEQQYWNSGVGAAMIVAMELKQAILDVESCQ